MIVALGDVYAQVPHLDEVRQLMRETQARTREQPGCLSYTFAETLDEPGRFIVAQEWEDRAALARHYRSQAFADYQAKVKLLLVRDSELRVSEVQQSVRPVALPGDDPQQDE